MLVVLLDSNRRTAFREKSVNGSPVDCRSDAARRASPTRGAKVTVYATHGLLLFLYEFYQRFCVSAGALTVNWFRHCRRLWRKKAVTEQEETALCQSLG
ncbi:MAG: hypothetical protein LKJ17_03800 [Oscillospiraceae bacterium]|nr:hypothetical protein [Oscillospiraceae bacterium]